VAEVPGKQELVDKQRDVLPRNLLQAKQLQQPSPNSRVDS
jgi:hypothetical protein